MPLFLHPRSQFLLHLTYKKHLKINGRSYQELRMNDKADNHVIKGSSRVDDKLPKTSNKSRVFIYKIWEFAKEDINRVTFSLKVGLAVLLVSLLILIQAPYQVFGTSVIWSILTVAIMFEYTVGMSSRHKRERKTTVDSC
ncbi:putative aluminum-activated malate transporter [Helianthus annuus]|nr:putative aluminum-activated malate transporter [Helianthus annuus]